MRITKDNLVKIEDEPIELFYQGMRAEDTKSVYTRRLRLVLCEYLESVLDGSFENRADRVMTAMASLDKKYLEILDIQKNAKFAMPFDDDE